MSEVNRNILYGSNKPESDIMPNVSYNTTTTGMIENHKQRQTEPTHHPLLLTAISSSQMNVEEQAAAARINPRHRRHPDQSETIESFQDKEDSKTTSTMIFQKWHNKAQRNRWQQVMGVNSKPGKIPWDNKQPVLG